MASSQMGKLEGAGVNGRHAQREDAEAGRKQVHMVCLKLALDEVPEGIFDLRLKAADEAHGLSDRDADARGLQATFHQPSEAVGTERQHPPAGGSGAGWSWGAVGASASWQR